MKVKIVFRHWKRDNELIEMVGILPEAYNPERSDLYVLLKDDGKFEDIRKDTVVSLEHII
jgi:hypothetical protein